MSKIMAVLMKWFNRSTAFLAGVALVVIAVGFSIGKIGSLSIRIQHPVPDLEFEIKAPSAAAPAPAITAHAKAPSTHAPASVTDHPGASHSSRRQAAAFQVADAAK